MEEVRDNRTHKAPRPKDPLLPGRGRPSSSTAPCAPAIETVTRRTRRHGHDVVEEGCEGVVGGGRSLVSIGEGRSRVDEVETLVVPLEVDYSLIL